MIVYEPQIGLLRFAAVTGLAHPENLGQVAAMNPKQTKQTLLAK